MTQKLTPIFIAIAIIISATFSTVTAQTTITGKVVDATSRQPLEAAVV